MSNTVASRQFQAGGWPLGIFVVLVVVCAWLMVRAWWKGVRHG